MNRQALFNRIRGAEDEFRVATIAVAALKKQLSRNPSALQQDGLSLSNVVDCHDNLETTYVVRLFVEFEAALRAYWKQVRGRHYRSRIHVRDLIGKVASFHHAPTDWLDHAQEVRERRNMLVHEQPVGPMLTLAECRSHLCRFLSLLPPTY
jgi:hypothetical protein